MIRCNNCYKEFDSEEDLKMIHEWYWNDCYYKGCDVCNTDEYLMDLDIKLPNTLLTPKNQSGQGDIMKTIKIDIDYNNIDSIEQAEKTKTRLENKGYKVINTFGGMRFTALIMGK